MRVLRAIPAVFILFLVACGFNNVNISISPGQATVTGNTQIQFTATVGNAGNKTVTWAATGGTVDSNGLYTAPAAPGICYVVVTSQADPTKTATAVITVVASVEITPSTITLEPGGNQVFSAVIPATGDTNVTWSITEQNGGTITPAGVYTAPSDAADTSVFHIVATSQADPSKSGTALVTIQTPVTLSPLSANIKVNTQQQFTATVRANPGAAVNWNLLPGDLVTTDLGTINGGLYTAPATPGTIYVVATTLDGSKKGQATVIVGN